MVWACENLLQGRWDRCKVEGPIKPEPLKSKWKTNEPTDEIYKKAKGPNWECINMVKNLKIDYLFLPQIPHTFFQIDMNG